VIGPVLYISAARSVRVAQTQTSSASAGLRPEIVGPPLQPRR
jgi:hypothetical protein